MPEKRKGRPKAARGATNARQSGSLTVALVEALDVCLALTVAWRVWLVFRRLCAVVEFCTRVSARARPRSWPPALELVEELTEPWAERCALASAPVELEAPACTPP